MLEKLIIQSILYYIEPLTNTLEQLIHKDRNEGWLLVGAVAQWQSTGTVSQRPWV